MATTGHNIKTKQIKHNIKPKYVITQSPIDFKNTLLNHSCLNHYTILFYLRGMI